MELQKTDLGTMLTTASNQEEVTMDSREISELTGKMHKHILTDIRKQLDEQGIGQTVFRHSYFNTQNKEQPCYKLNKRQTTILVSGYSLPIRIAIIDRLEELEKILQKPREPRTYIQALKALVVAEEEKEQLKLTANIQENRITRLVHNTNTYTTTQIAKELGFASAKKFNKELHEKGILYKDNRGVWLLYSEYADKGFMNIKQKEVDRSAGPDVVYYSVWTGLGRDWLLGLFSA